MEIIYHDLPILKENDRSYFRMLEAVINSVDELSILDIRRNLENFSFRIAMSSTVYITPLIQELNSLHNMINIKVDFSKSIKSSSSLSFKINLEK